MVPNRERARYRLAQTLQITEEPEGLILSWIDPESGRRLSSLAGPDDLTGIAIAESRLSPEEAARERGAPLRAIYRMLSLLDRVGILEAPQTLLRRDLARFPYVVADSVSTVTVSPLQWHITSSCDLHCRHCYDRSPRGSTGLAEAVCTLEQFEQFCRCHWVEGTIAFTGGNPFLNPDFPRIYAEAVRRGFGVSVMGNPVLGEQVEALCAIAKPGFFQISLEGLREHNDRIRGEGAFDRALQFLEVLQSLEVPSCVMMTLTKQNLAQALPLARLLEGKTSRFSAALLSRMGEGAALQASDPAEYQEFLEQWVQAAQENPEMGFKDNLTNLVLLEQGSDLCGGCTGFGCGAAFDGLVLLPDGEVHACRRLPSLVGSLREMSLEEAYQSEAARRYRRGLPACDGCELLHVCGGCLAQARGEQRDPYCWKRRIEP